MTYRAVKCPCGDAVCNNWFVDPVAAHQGVSFTKEQAHAVADLLNSMKPKGIERFSSYSIMMSLDGHEPKADPHGHWVRYDDHIEEMERITKEWVKST